MKRQNFVHFSARIAFLKLLIALSKSTKRKQMALTVTQKLELIRKLEKGAIIIYFKAISLVL